MGRPRDNRPESPTHFVIILPCATLSRLPLRRGITVFSYEVVYGVVQVVCPVHRNRTGSEDELHDPSVNRVYPEREPERREQRVLETRSWPDPTNKPDGR